jgi:hypothetical protein
MFPLRFALNLFPVAQEILNLIALELRAFLCGFVFFLGQFGTHVQAYRVKLNQVLVQSENKKASIETQLLFTKDDTSIKIHVFSRHGLCYCTASSISFLCSVCWTAEFFGAAQCHRKVEGLEHGQATGLRRRC